MKLHKEIDSLKKDLSNFIKGFDNLNMLLKYEGCKRPNDRSGHGLGKKYIHDEDVDVCYFCGKPGHITSKSRHLPKKGASSAFQTNKKGPKSIWVPKDKIVPIANMLNRRKETPVMVPG